MTPMRIQNIGAVTVGPWIVREIGGILGTSGMWTTTKEAIITN